MATTAGPEKISTDNVGLAFALVIAAGLSTAVGAAAVYCNSLVRLASKPILAAGLGFSGGVMLYVSFIEIFQKAKGAFEAVEGLTPEQAYICTTGCTFGGMAMMRFIAWLVHKLDGDHDHCVCDDSKKEVSITDRPIIRSNVMGSNEIFDLDEPGLAASLDTTGNDAKNACSDLACGDHACEKGEQPASQQNEQDAATEKAAKDAKLMKMGLNTAVAIGIHNFPEGLATFVATLADPVVGATLAVAIAIHNIPEGLCVALPIYYATGSRHKGFMWALWSGLSEPIGALIGYGIIKASGDDMNQVVYGILFGVVAGMMVMIVIMELMPTAYRYDPADKYVTNSLVAGMCVMAASLCLFMA